MPLNLNSFIFSIIILINMALASLDEPEKVTMMDAINYLQKYGYVRHSNLLENAFNNSVIKDTQTIIKRGIAEFQETAGLPKTGDLDIKTKEMFTAPRCSVSDFHAQTEFDMKWEKNDLVYTILNYSPDLTRDEIREAIAAAFAKWSAVIPLNFKEADQDDDHIDIHIGFYRKGHGDNDPFDGEDITDTKMINGVAKWGGGALAHAHWPPNGDIHFDDDEKWAYKNEEKILLKKNNKYVYRDLLQTAIHEIGHAIGLDHVRRNDSIMKTFYVVSTDNNGRYIEPQLFQSDIEKIQARYGARITASPQTSKPKEKPFTRDGFYAAKRGDTAKTIADAFDISVDDLKTFNPRLDINKINPGKWMRVIEDRESRRPVGLIATPNIKQQIGPCSADWTYYEKSNKCLRLSPNSGFFNDIDSYCKSNGATLVTIHSADENNFLADFVQKALSSSSSSSVWIGLVDQDKDAFFTWNDDSDFDFLDWQPNQPDNVDGNQHNVIFGPLVKGKSESGHWNDIDGETNKFHGVCQKKAQNTDKIEQPITTTSKPSTTSTTSIPTTTSITSIPTTTTPELFQNPEENNLPSTEKPFTGHNDGCHDANLCCPVWVQQGLCEGNPNWMSENCRLSCGYCIASINYRDSMDCYDTSDECDAWSRLGYCVRDPDYMLKNCRQSCRVCISLDVLQGLMNCV